MAPEAGPAAKPAPVPAVLVAGQDAEQRNGALQALLLERPRDQTWAVITSGLDTLETLAALPGVRAAFAAPGCLCCTGLLPFRVGLVRLLRDMADAPPARLLIEAGASMHPEQLRTALEGAQFATLIRLEPAHP